MDKRMDHCLNQHYFVAGTDTGIGKTLIASALLYALNQTGVGTAGMKPVAAGTEWRNGAWHNDDVDALAAQASVAVPPALATPFLLRQASAPHIAAQNEGKVIDLPHILDCYRQVASMAEAVVVEGVGGFRVPLDERYDTADLAQQLALPVLLVVGLRLGCINHALLTLEAIAARGLRLAGWVANTIDTEMLNGAATIAAIGNRINAPLLGHVPRLPAVSAAVATSYLNFTCLPGWSASKN